MPGSVQRIVKMYQQNGNKSCLWQTHEIIYEKSIHKMILTQTLMG